MVDPLLLAVPLLGLAAMLLMGFTGCDRIVLPGPKFSVYTSWCPRN